MKFTPLYDSFLITQYPANLRGKVLPTVLSHDARGADTADRRGERQTQAAKTERLGYSCLCTVTIAVSLVIVITTYVNTCNCMSSQLVLNFDFPYESINLGSIIVYP